MARKNILKVQIANAKSLSADFTTDPTVVKFLDNCSYQINITTTNSTGTFTLQGSDDFNMDEPENSITNSGTWVDLPLGGGTPTVAAANDSILISMNQLPFTAIRLKYVKGTAGTGTCDIWLVCKQLGG